MSLGSFGTSFPLFPVAAAEGARRVDHLLWGWVLLAGLVALGLFGTLAFFVVRYREGSPADRSPVTVPAARLEWGWTFASTAVFLAMFGWATWAYYVNENAPPGADEVYVVAKQWMWKVQHPGGQRELDELHLPVGRAVKLVLTSEDVIHSFYVPAFRMKQDVLPGRYTTEWFKPDRVGEYHLFCAEFCGTDHSRMTGRVVVMAPADYEAWLRGTGEHTGLAARGKAVFTRAGCAGCHGPSATVHAPPLEGVYGRPQPLAGGGFAVADEAYLRDAILLPAKQVVAGYPPIMPSFEGQLGEDELVELVAYLKSLGDAKAPLSSPERSAVAP